MRRGVARPPSPTLLCTRRNSDDLTGRREHHHYSRCKLMRLRMSSADDYRKRAEQCVARARSVTRPDDRARWLQLANEWTILAGIEFQRLPPPSGNAISLWRGERAAHSEKSAA